MAAVVRRGHEHCALRVKHAVAQGGCAELGIQRNNNRAYFGAPRKGYIQFGYIGQKKKNPVATPEAQPPQHIAEAVGKPVHLGI